MTAHQFSPRFQGALAQPNLELTPWSAENLVRSFAPDPVPAYFRQIESALFTATGERGLPVLDGWVLGSQEAVLRSGNPRCRNRAGAGAPTELLFAWHEQCGSLYVDPQRHLRDAQGSTVSLEVYSFLERLVIFEQWGSVPVRALLNGEQAYLLFSALKAHRDGGASDGWVDVWTTEDILLVDHQQTYEARFRSWEVIPRFLTVAQRCQAEVHFTSPGPYRVEESDAEFSVEPLRTSASSLMELETLLLLGCDLRNTSAFEGTASQHRIFTWSEFTPSGARVRRFSPASRHIGSWASQRLLAYCLACGLTYDPELALSFEGLAEALDHCGLPYHDAWFEFEERCGGLRWDCWPSRPQKYMPQLGLRPFLTASVDQRQEPWTSQNLSEGAWPTAQWQAHTLIYVARETPLADCLFLDPQGQCYLHSEETDCLARVADSGTFFLEKLAARWEMRTRVIASSPVALDQALGPELAAQLALPLIPEASDSVSQLWSDGELWIWNRPLEAPNTALTSLVGCAAKRVAEAVQLAQRMRPNAQVHASSEGWGGEARIAALRALGITVQEGGDCEVL